MIKEPLDIIAEALSEIEETVGNNLTARDTAGINKIRFELDRLRKDFTVQTIADEAQISSMDAPET